MCDELITTTPHILHTHTITPYVQALSVWMLYVLAVPTVCFFLPAFVSSLSNDKLVD